MAPQHHTANAPAPQPQPDLTARYTRFRVESGVFLGGVVRPYLLDALILILVALIAWAVNRDRHTAPKVEFVVARPSGIEPFRPIVASDLSLDCKSKNPVPAAAAAPLTGRYSPVFIKTCDPVDPARLSANPVSPSDLLGRVLIRLKAQPTSLFAGMGPPFKAGLMFAPHEHGDSPLFLDNVLILDVQTGGDGLSVVAAVLDSDQPAVASFVARSDVLLVGSTR
jgi:hypothetical protein